MRIKLILPQTPSAAHARRLFFCLLGGLKLPDTVIERFVAVAADGRRYRMTIYQRWLVAPTLANEHPSPDPGQRYGRTFHNEHVNINNDGTYDVLDSGALVRVTRL